MPSITLVQLQEKRVQLFQTYQQTVTQANALVGAIQVVDLLIEDTKKSPSHDSDISE